MPARLLCLLVATAAVSGCHAEPTPTSATPPVVPLTLTRIAIVATPGELPIGGGVARIGIETNAGGAVAPRVTVALTSSTGALEQAEVTTDGTGHATVVWTGDRSTAITASTGSVVGTMALRVLTPPVPLPPSVPVPGEPTPPPFVPPPAVPGFEVTLVATPSSVAAGTPQTFRAVVGGLHSGEAVRSYQWVFEGGGTSGTVGTSTTTEPQATYTYGMHGRKNPSVVVTTGERQGGATTPVVITGSTPVR